ncbi:MAG: hypothetical protein GWP06_15795 [Actinobacteria bacterium]|nr:hypothetical protein [Actinomycetota bacterium]
MKKHLNRQVLWLTSILILVFSMTAWADTLVLKDGRVLQGTFKGCAENAIQFEVDGKIQQIALAEITSLAFSPRAAQPAPAEQTPPPATGPVTVPAGTVLMVKIDKAINTATHKAGATITAVLETPLAVNGKVVAPKGTQLYGKVIESVGGRAIGNKKIVFQFTGLMINNQLLPIQTGVLGAEGGKGGVAKTAAAGALIGAGVDSKDRNKGAKTGALIGAGAAMVGGGKHIQIPAGTLAEIPIEAPLTIQ